MSSFLFFEHFTGVLCGKSDTEAATQNVKGTAFVI